MMANRIKILALHGYRQNADKFRKQTGALRKLLKNVDFFFLSAPHSVPLETKLSEEDERSWWFTKESSFSSRDKTNDDHGFEESLKLVKDTFQSEGPFEGILGFSQGASFVSLICALKETNSFEYQFKFVLIVSGFKSLSTPHLNFFEGVRIQTPSLHLIGNNDQVITKETSESLALNFENPLIIYHEGGHYVAASSSNKKIFAEFILKHSS